MLWTKSWKREKPGFKINICTVHQFWGWNSLGAAEFICWVGTLPIELTARLPLKIGLYPCPKRNPDGPIPIMFCWFVILLLDSFRECIVTTQMLHTMEHVPTLMAKMYGPAYLYSYIYHEFGPNVGKCNIHWSFGHSHGIWVRLSPPLCKQWKYQEKTREKQKHNQNTNPTFTGNRGENSPATKSIARSICSPSTRVFRCPGISGGEKLHVMDPILGDGNRDGSGKWSDQWVTHRIPGSLVFPSPSNTLWGVKRSPKGL